jgi:predicted RND superfamily exporter protein
MITLQQRLEQDPDVRAVLSPAAVMGFLNCQFAQSGRCTVQAPARPEEAQQIWTVLFGGGREAAMLDEQARHTRLRAFVQTDRAQDTQRLITIIDRLAAEQGLAVSLGGSAVTAKALADGIVRVSLEKAALLVAIVILIGGIVFRSVKMALLFAIPSVLTIAANFAYLGWSGTTLNVATAAVATIAVGVGLDYLIYLTFRIREAQRRGALYVQSIREGLASAGGAAVCVASAVAIGYAVLIFSPGYLVHHWIAALVPMTMIMSLFGALFVFPYLVRLARPSFEGRVDLMDHVDADLAHYFGNTRIS